MGEFLAAALAIDFTGARAEPTGESPSNARAAGVSLARETVLDQEPCQISAIEPGQAGVYDVRAIHAIDYPEGSRFVRVTGRDLDHVKRLKYDEAAGKAIVIESASASR